MLSFVVGGADETRLRAIFDSATCGSCTLLSPGVAGLKILYASINVQVEGEVIADAMGKINLCEDDDLDWKKFLELSALLGAQPGAATQDCASRTAHGPEPEMDYCILNAGRVTCEKVSGVARTSASSTGFWKSHKLAKARKMKK